jgi:arabinose-5-phosphate isomerase
MLAKRIGAEAERSIDHQFSDHRRLERARRVFQAEASAIQLLEAIVDEAFSRAVDLILTMRGRLLVTGIGKAGLIGQKIAATFSSTGTPAHFVHPAEAVHGDLGKFHADDVVLVLSNSGETEEVVRLLPILRENASVVLAITANGESTLAKASAAVLSIPKTPEACSHGLAPSSSTAAMLAMGDALAIVVADERGFEAEHFARFHPGGSLGIKLRFVDEVMRPVAECRISRDDATIREVIVKVARPGRRTGAVMLTDEAGTLVGLFTDSDLAKLLERRDDTVLDQPIALFMKKQFLSVASGSRLPHALGIIAERKISELPVVDGDYRPIGLIDITDVVAWLDPISEDEVESDDGTLRIYNEN